MIREYDFFLIDELIFEWIQNYNTSWHFIVVLKHMLLYLLERGGNKWQRVSKIIS